MAEDCYKTCDRADDANHSGDSGNTIFSLKNVECGCKKGTAAMMLVNSGTRLRNVLSVICLLSLATLTLLAAQTTKTKRGYSPHEGMVPDKDTAIKIAEAVLTPIYGKEVVEHERPFRVELVNGVWIVDGATHPGPGGNLHIEVSKKDGCIMRVIGTE